MRMSEHIHNDIKNLFLLILCDLALQNHCCRLEWYSPIGSSNKEFFLSHGAIYDD